MAKPNKSATETEMRVERYTWGEIYKGTAEALIAAGLAEVGKLPGCPGQNKTMITIKDGDDTRPFKIVRTSKFVFEAWKNATPEERKRREAESEKERQQEKEKENAEGRRLVNAYRAIDRIRTSDVAQFRVGESAILWSPGNFGHGELVEIIGEYQTWFLLSEDGRDLNNGKKGDWCFGYLIKIGSGESLASPGELRDVNHRIRHLKLIAA